MCVSRMSLSGVIPANRSLDDRCCLLIIIKGEQIMSKGQNEKKDGKKKPVKTLKEKKQAKRDKKDQKDSPGILTK